MGAYANMSQKHGNPKHFKFYFYRGLSYLFAAGCLFCFNGLFYYGNIFGSLHQERKIATIAEKTYESYIAMPVQDCSGFAPDGDTPEGTVRGTRQKPFEDFGILGGEKMRSALEEGYYREKARKDYEKRNSS